ncbi:hypothetical protein ASPWEDRAFT_170651 [Aspergillus wentii DTO 134E9]|uniref:Uncharacterized protein n=1 Tax=Aspergillus wentii DTO 134E9 TaxID=1073089 RepID=A0A1L9RQC9_ASPWE|nr:uncharacterized protein ASPWEDRAFT_170651 [Aspergillus wentii DTO 134E9]KAI9928350.1 hypothetical protein MW887_002388 [Aspergillus wentii]OJJ37166.1 hypothetical protein ASPWEDRAFT_170651 [Aspergillus wentii DTO 134E9]
MMLMIRLIFTQFHSSAGRQSFLKSPIRPWPVCRHSTKGSMNERLYQSTGQSGSKISGKIITIGVVWLIAFAVFESFERRRAKREIIIDGHRLQSIQARLLGRDSRSYLPNDTTTPGKEL